MLEKKLQEELNRYRAINKYTKTMIMEQDVPPLPAEDPAAIPPAGDVPPMDAGAPPMDAGIPPAGDVPPGGAPPAEGAIPPAPDLDSTEEIDITDLVNMTKSIKKDLDDRKEDNSGVITKMDDVFTKLNDLEEKLAQMDMVMNRINQLDAKLEKIKQPTPVEKLEMRSLDSYPFNQKPQEFFAQKQGEMRASGKNEYVLTKDEVMDYPIETIKDTFNPEEEENEFKY